MDVSNMAEGGEKVDEIMDGETPETENGEVAADKTEAIDKVPDGQIGNAADKKKISTTCFENCNVSDGEDNMIGCDNSDCEREWYHFSCVGIKDQPTGQWYCPADECQQKMVAKQKTVRKKKTTKKTKAESQEGKMAEEVELLRMEQLKLHARLEKVKVHNLKRQLEIESAKQKAESVAGNVIGSKSVLRPKVSNLTGLPSLSPPTGNIAKSSG